MRLFDYSRTSVKKAYKTLNVSLLYSTKLRRNGKQCSSTKKDNLLCTVIIFRSHLLWPPYRFIPRGTICWSEHNIQLFEFMVCINSISLDFHKLLDSYFFCRYKYQSMFCWKYSCNQSHAWDYFLGVSTFFKDHIRIALHDFLSHTDGPLMEKCMSQLLQMDL